MPAEGHDLPAETLVAGVDLKAKPDPLEEVLLAPAELKEPPKSASSLSLYRTIQRLRLLSRLFFSNMSEGVFVKIPIPRAAPRCIRA